MDQQLLRTLGVDADLDQDSPTGKGGPGKSSLTARLTPAPQVVLRVADPETARALGESLSGGARARVMRDVAAGALGARDANGVAAGADAMVERASASSGSPLPAHVQRQFEDSLGADLSAVRVHTGTDSAAAAHAVGAKAYTVGNDIHFAEGRYAPDDPFGMHLLAHEVAHTVQQARGAQRRQHKLEVSTPHDAAEHEADRAADAMVRGEAATVSGSGGVARQVVQREPGVCEEAKPNPFLHAGPGKCEMPDHGGPKGAGPSGPGQFDAPVSNPFGPFQPNADANGVPYDIPTVDYRSQAVPKAPPLNAAMPSAQVSDPGTIPGWMTVRPGQKVGLPPFEIWNPPAPYVVHGPLHSKTAVDAWIAYKNELIPHVSSTWDGDARAKLDSYTQETKGNADLDKIVAETKKSYNVDIQQGKGTISEQGAKQQVSPGRSTQQIADDVAKGGADLKQGAADSAAQPSNTTVSGPVKAAVDALNAQRETRCGLMKELAGHQGDLDGSKTDLQAAEAEAAEWAGKEASEEEKKKDPHFEKAKEIAGKMSPKLKSLVQTIEKYKEPLMKMKEVGENGMKAYAKEDAKAALDAAVGLAEVAKWVVLQGRVAELEPAKDNPRLLKIKAAHQHTKAAVDKCAGVAAQIEAALKTEKRLYDNVAAELEKHWKGKDPAQGKAAADALRAIPHVDRIVRMLKEMKGAMPKLPSASTRASQGFALATQGYQAPGAADLLQVAGWVLGAPEAIAPEIGKWEGIRAQLESIAGAMGIV